MTGLLSATAHAQILERAEAVASTDFTRAAPSELAAELGIHASDHHGAAVLIAARIDVLALNRVINLGIEEAAPQMVLDEIVAEYRKARVRRFFVQLSPTARPATLVEWLRARGFAHYNNWMKLYRELDTRPDLHTDLRVEEIGAAEAGVFAEIVTTAFGMPDSARPWIAASVGRPGWHHYLAFDGQDAVATGALHVQERVGWMGFASTRAGFRGRGAQSALIARRIRDAQAWNCDVLIAETAEDRPDRRAPSFHNLRRLGFQVAYARPNYLWTLPAPEESPASG